MRASDNLSRWAAKTERFDPSRCVQIGSHGDYDLCFVPEVRPAYLAEQFVGEACATYRPTGEVVSVVVVSAGDGALLADFETHPHHRRRGLATALFDAAEKHLGAALRPSEPYSAEAEAFWKARGVARKQNPMRQPEDAPSFRFAVLEDGSDGRIVLEAYDGPETLAFITARPAKFARTKNRRIGVGVRASTLSDLESPDPRQNVVWTVESVHATPGWGPLMYEALLAFAALEGYSGWVTSDIMVTSLESERVWERFAERDDVEFRAFVGRNTRGEKMHAARALPALAAKRAALFD